MVNEKLRIVHNVTDSTVESGKEAIKNNTEIFPVLFNYFFLPLIIGLILIIILKYNNEIKIFINKKLSSHGYVKIWVRMDNKDIKKKMVKLDEYNNFVFKKGKYNLDKMDSFIFGYENNIPIVIYNNNYFMPCEIDIPNNEEEVIKDIREAYIDYTEEEIKQITDKKINALRLKINPQIIKTIYDKKLVQDLYKVSTAGNEFLVKYGFWILIGVGILFLYVTGYLEPILQEFLGIKLGGK